MEVRLSKFETNYPYCINYKIKSEIYQVVYHNYRLFSIVVDPNFASYWLDGKLTWNLRKLKKEIKKYDYN